MDSARSDLDGPAKVGQTCPCVTRGPEHFSETTIGVDETAGRFADVAIRRCRQCDRCWLHYQYEVEGFTASGRWYAGVIEPARIAHITPVSAPAVLASLQWHVYGGSYFCHAGNRADGGADVT